MAETKPTTAPAPAKQEAKEEETTKFVKHNPAPGFSVRAISREAWATLGVDMDDTEWNAQNRYRIPASEFGPKALNYLKGDDGFEIVDE